MAKTPSEIRIRIMIRVIIRVRATGRVMPRNSIQVRGRVMEPIKIPVITPGRTKAAPVRDASPSLRPA